MAEDCLGSGIRSTVLWMIMLVTRANAVPAAQRGCAVKARSAGVSLFHSESARLILKRCHDGDVRSRRITT